MTKKEAIELISKYGTSKDKRCCSHSYNFYAMGKHLKHHKFDDGITLAVCQICGQSSCYKEYHHAGAGYEYTTVDMPFEAGKFLVENKLEKAYKILGG